MNQQNQLQNSQLKLSWQNIKKKIIKKYPQYQIIIEQNQLQFSKLDYTKKENQQRLIQMIVLKQQEELQYIFTQEQELQSKENEKQIKKLASILKRNTEMKSKKHPLLEKHTITKPVIVQQIVGPKKQREMVSDTIEAWNHIDDTQSFIHEYEDSTQDNFYITKDVFSPSPEEQLQLQPQKSKSHKKGQAKNQQQSELKNQEKKLKKGQQNMFAQEKKQVKFEKISGNSEESRHTSEKQSISDDNKNEKISEDEQNDEDQEEQEEHEEQEDDADDNADDEDEEEENDEENVEEEESEDEEEEAGEEEEEEEEEIEDDQEEEEDEEEENEEDGEDGEENNDDLLNEQGSSSQDEIKDNKIAIKKKS